MNATNAGTVIRAKIFSGKTNLAAYQPSQTMAPTKKHSKNGPYTAANHRGGQSSSKAATMRRLPDNKAVAEGIRD
ncbi:MAG TPA: hypothetical protein VMF08_13070 [Candidatus Sulfotelmatobacter sp.]|nr:hypothetical protein [Candidatus Sulfotelmatobacter sp.]